MLMIFTRGTAVHAVSPAKSKWDLVILMTSVFETAKLFDHCQLLHIATGDNGDSDMIDHDYMMRRDINDNTLAASISRMVTVWCSDRRLRGSYGCDQSLSAVLATSPMSPDAVATFARIGKIEEDGRGIQRA